VQGILQGKLDALLTYEELQRICMVAAHRLQAASPLHQGRLRLHPIASLKKQSPRESPSWVTCIAHAVRLSLCRSSGATLAAQAN